MATYRCRNDNNNDAIHDKNDNEPHWILVDSNGYKLAQQQQQQNSQQQNSVLVSSNRYLNIQRAKESDGGIYECIASNSHDADLRKLVHVQVRGK